ncbi:EpsG family protein [Enterovibrio baiacu]|uniref:EpsG family protein n=1 Tax=Enterovibrio baiacu TaxID=2491023 RepID=UPI003B846B1F
MVVPVYFAAINAMKLPESDLLVYVEAISVIADKNFFEVLTFKYVSLRSTEFLFNYYIWFISLVDNSGWLFSFLSTYIIYFNVSLALCNIFTVKKKELLYLIMAMLLFSITFSLVGHLVRQYFAASFLLLGLSYLDSRRKLGVMLALSSVFLHNSMFLFILTFPFAKHLLSSRHWIKYTIALLLIAYILGSASSYLKPYMEIAFMIDDGSIPLSLVIFDLSLFCFLVLFKFKNKHIENRVFNIYCFSVLLLCCLLVSRDISLLFFRFYFLADLLRPFVILSLSLIISNRGMVKPLLVYIILILSILVFIARFHSTPWDYGLDPFSILFDSTVMDLINRYMEF